MFIDVAKISVRAGNGGNGAVSFHREKYINAGGPDGGDGGKGGNIVFVSVEGANTLIDFQYKRKYMAENGHNGDGGKRSGKSGQDLYIEVPVGTIVKDASSGIILADITKKGQREVIAKGGKGGAGNARFATPTRQIPLFSKAGKEGEVYDLILELKLIADVGLIGFPNVGKSSVLAKVTAASPKIADYHFTTLSPNLGVVRIDYGESFVIADIPGLIEGAHEGAGLGHEFLRHVERTRLLIHVVDISGIENRDPLEDFEKINSELSLYNPELSQKPQIVAANKTDLLDGDEKFNKFKDALTKKGYNVFAISAATGKGLDSLMSHTQNALKQLPQNEGFTDIHQEALYKAKEGGPLFTVEKQNDIYVVEGAYIRKLMSEVNFQSYEALQYLHRVLIKIKLMEKLEEMGVAEGDTVSLEGYELEYRK